MSEPIRLETLPRYIKAAIEQLYEEASLYSGESRERDALLAEVAELRAMSETIRAYPATEWKRHRSPLIANAAREYLKVPDSLIEQIGRIYEVCRRCSHRPCPHCGLPLRSENARQCFHCGADWH